MPFIVSEEEFKTIKFGDIVYTGHTEEADFIWSSRPEEASFYLKWFVFHQGNDLSCSLIETEKRELTFGVLSLQEFFSMESDESFPKEELIKKINEIDSKLKEKISFDKTRVLGRRWIHKVEKNSTTQSDGMHCCECNEYYHYAVPNLSDKRMACWNCRDSYKWKYLELFIG